MTAGTPISDSVRFTGGAGPARDALYVEGDMSERHRQSLYPNREMAKLPIGTPLTNYRASDGAAAVDADYSSGTPVPLNFTLAANTESLHTLFQLSEMDDPASADPLSRSPENADDRQHHLQQVQFRRHFP